MSSQATSNVNSLFLSGSFNTCSVTKITCIDNYFFVKAR